MTNIRIDTSPLTYTQFLIPGVTSGPVDGAHAALLSLAPGTYNFQQQSGSSADFDFRVTSDGTIDYDVLHNAFLGGRGSDTLIVRGFPVALDSTQLSHSILPTVVGAAALAPDRIHQLMLVPAAGYAFISASGVDADFSFGVKTDGTVVVDPRFAGFAQASGQTLTIMGYRITLDTRELTQDVSPSLLGWTGGILSPGLHEFTSIPAAGYAMVLQGTPSDIHFSLGVDGTTTLTHAPAGMTIILSPRIWLNWPAYLGWHPVELRYVAMRLDTGHGPVWITARDDTFWVVITPDPIIRQEPSPGRLGRVAASYNDDVWCVSLDGALWRRRADGAWIQISTQHHLTDVVEDVTVAADNTVRSDRGTVLSRGRWCNSRSPQSPGRGLTPRL